MRYFASLFVLLVLLPSGMVLSQPIPSFQLKVDPFVYQTIRNPDSGKSDLGKVTFEMNGVPLRVKEIHSRGNNSLRFERKSLSVDLKDPVNVGIGDTLILLKKFDLINLSMDRYSWHNRWAFLNLSELGLFPLHQSFCTLTINGVPQGIYLLLEKPKHAAERMKSPYLLRRGLKHALDDEYAPTSAKALMKSYRKQYLDVYQNIHKLKGQALYESLQASIDIDQYFSWMAFNFLVMNGDYSDELYWYIPPDDKRFRLIPWDYDDLFRVNPHEGAAARAEVDRMKLVFSIEDELDRAIAEDDVLYAAYVKVMVRMLAQLTEERMANHARGVASELELLAKDKGTAAATQYLDKEPFSTEGLHQNIAQALEMLSSRRKMIALTLEKTMH